jgi:GntR family transcriptional regulator
MQEKIMAHLNVSQRLHDRLGRIIAAAEPGTRLPSEPELAKDLGVSRATLREAMRTFETQGLIRRKQGSGTYVTHPSAVIESGLEVLESIETLTKRINLEVAVGEGKVEIRQARPEEKKALNLDGDCEVIQVSRVILAENRPAAYLVDTLPKDLLTPDELKNYPVGSVLDFLLQRGTPRLVTSRTEINAVTAPSDLARLLGIQRGDVLLHFNSLLYSDSGRVVDVSQSYFLPGYFRFHVVRRVG